MIVEIQCRANPPGPPEDRYRHIDAAIAIVERSGLTFEVGALGTTVEGEPDALWALLRGVHEACLQAGADSVVAVIKIAQSRDPARQSTIAGLTGKFR